MPKIDWSTNFNSISLNLSTQKNWLVTGGAGFIGSHIVSSLLSYHQKVIVLDNFTGGYKNINAVQKDCSVENKSNLKIYEADIRDYNSCLKAVQGVDMVLHQAALTSVPESIINPMTYHQVNVEGFWNILESSREAGVKRVVYASSSAVYGNDTTISKVEEIIAKPLSPYAGTKQINEVQAQIYQSVYGLETIGLRYFNVYGSRQNPFGAYASVIPKWIYSILNNQPCVIYGDGENTRDFCHVYNVVLANFLAATTNNKLAVGQVYNIGLGTEITLNKLFKTLTKAISSYLHLPNYPALNYEPFRKGDIRQSLSNITKAQKFLEYAPQVLLEEGLEETIAWYIENNL